MVVSDYGKNTLTVLKADTGEVVTMRQLTGFKGLRGVTTDTAGNVYVCYQATDEVSVLNGDLSGERFLLTRQDGLSCSRWAIVYDETRNQLITSYWSRDTIDCFQLS